MCFALVATWLGLANPPSASASPADPLIDEAIAESEAVYQDAAWPHLDALWRLVVDPVYDVVEGPLGTTWEATVEFAFDRAFDLFWSVRDQTGVADVCFPFAMTVVCV